MSDWIEAAAAEIAEYAEALCTDQALGGNRTLRWEGPSTSHIVAAIIARHIQPTPPPGMTACCHSPVGTHREYCGGSGKGKR